MVNLMEALCANRLCCTSSRCVFKLPTSSFINHTTLQLTAADGSFVCSLSPSTVMLVLDGKPVAAVVTANSFGDNGVWIQVSSGKTAPRTDTKTASVVQRAETKASLCEALLPLLPLLQHITSR